jgi:uncharacterized protein YjbI with pentapeptide repeats
MTRLSTADIDALLGPAMRSARPVEYLEIDGLDLTMTSLPGLRVNRLAGIGVILDGAVLDDVRISESNLEKSSLRGAVIDDSMLFECKFSAANLAGLESARTYWTYCSFREADLREVSFVDCRVEACHFERAQLSGARFERCILQQIDLTSIDGLGGLLFGCRLEACRLRPDQVQELAAGANVLVEQATDL